MTEVAAAIEVGRLALATAEGLLAAIEKAKHALESSTTQLRDALVELEKRHDKMEAQRAAEDKALEEKFDTGGES